MNYELNGLIGNADIVRFIKSRRIALLGHVMRTDDKRTPKRILQWKPIGTRTRGRSQKRLDCRNWRRFANNGSKTVEKAMWRNGRMEEKIGLQELKKICK
jgi:hypothetical protein